MLIVLTCSRTLALQIHTPIILPVSRWFRIEKWALLESIPKIEVITTSFQTKNGVFYHTNIMTMFNRNFSPVILPLLAYLSRSSPDLFGRSSLVLRMYDTGTYMSTCWPGSRAWPYRDTPADRYRVRQLRYLKLPKRVTETHEYDF